MVAARPRTPIQLEHSKIIYPHRALALYLLKDAVDHIEDPETAEWVAQAGEGFRFWCSVAEVEPLSIVRRARQLLGVPEPELCQTVDTMRSPRTHGEEEYRNYTSLCVHLTRKAKDNSSNPIHEPDFAMRSPYTHTPENEGKEGRELLGRCSFPIECPPDTLPPTVRYANGAPEIAKTAKHDHISLRNLRHKKTPCVHCERIVSTETEVESDALYYSVMHRDGGLCRYCGSSATVLDHVLPVCLGGETAAGNLVAACVSCNCRKRGVSAFRLRIRSSGRQGGMGALTYLRNAICPAGLYGERLWAFIKAYPPRRQRARRAG